MEFNFSVGMGLEITFQNLTVSVGCIVDMMATFDPNSIPIESTTWIMAKKKLLLGLEITININL